MNIVCARSSEELLAEPLVSILVLPEDISISDVNAATQRFPAAIVVAAVRTGKHMRGYLIANGENKLDYLKMLGDGRSDAYTGPQELPIHEGPGIAVGVLICRDYQSNDLRLPMLERLRRTTASAAVICIPADMSGDFFAQAQIDVFPGVFCALSNNRKTYENPYRCRSFIANRNGIVISRQIEYEATFASTA